MVAMVATASVVAAPSAVRADDDRELEVMTQNLYLGSSLTPALGATTPEGFIAGVAAIYNTMLATDFPARARAIADEIARDEPDLIGLQEVSNWIAQPTAVGRSPVSFDFLEILQEQLVYRGLDYVVAATSDNANIGPVPLVAPQFGCVAPTAPDCVLTFRDRDVILANDDVDELTWTNARSGHFEAQATVTVPTGDPEMPTAEVSFDRGWASIDATFDGDRFRFVNTHLEVEDFEAVQEAQAGELIAGPLHTLRPVIAVGDFNSAADGSTTDTYRLMLKALFIDAWWTNFGKRGFTCCQAERLDNEESLLKSRIDFVFTRRALPTEAHLVGDEPFQYEPPLWMSDHAGVVATVKLF